MKRFLVALQFLTIFPIKIKKDVKNEDWGKSLVYFPLVGLFLGLGLVLVSIFFSFLPSFVIAGLIIVVSVIVTGGIHLDGFADTCDGLYGFQTKEKALEIMRDSHIGTMAVTGVTLLLLLKFTLLSSISKINLWRFLILMTVFARWSQVFACFSSNYSRGEGKAKYFIECAGITEFLIGTFFTLVLFLLLMKKNGFILFLVSLISIWLLINWIKRKIEGMTGDTIGAVSEIAELLILFLGLIITG